MQCSVRPLIQQLRFNEKSNNILFNVQNSIILYIELLKFENSKLIQKTKFLYFLREPFHTHVNANISHVIMNTTKRIFHSQLTNSYCLVITQFYFYLLILQYILIIIEKLSIYMLKQILWNITLILLLIFFLEKFISLNLTASAALSFIYDLLTIINQNKGYF